jgi:hypothetical protein
LNLSLLDEVTALLLLKHGENAFSFYHTNGSGALGSWERQIKNYGNYNCSQAAKAAMSIYQDDLLSISLRNQPLQYAHQTGL